MKVLNPTVLRGRAAALFVARPGATAHALPARGAVLGRGGAAVGAAAALAGELLAASPVRAAAVCVWHPAHERMPVGAPATPAARRLARRFAAGGLAVTPRGRLVWLALPADPAAALDSAQRVWSATDAPLVVALAAARHDAFTPLLHEQEIVVVATSPEDPPALAELVVAELAPHVPVLAAAAPALTRRALALSGAGRLPEARAVLGSRAA